MQRGGCWGIIWEGGNAENGGLAHKGRKWDKIVDVPSAEEGVNGKKNLVDHSLWVTPGCDIE